jgi:hypothetical protein
MIHPRSSRRPSPPPDQLRRRPLINRPRWLQSPEPLPEPSLPESSSDDPWIDAATKEEPSPLKRAMARLPRRRWISDPDDIDYD